MNAPLISRWLCLIGVFCTGWSVVAAEPTDPRAEVDAAYARLNATAYRKREIMQGPMAGMAGMKPIVTECVAGRSKLVSEMVLPELGQIRTEQIRLGTRTAYRMTAPGVTRKLTEMRQKLTINSAKTLIQQAISVLMAAQTGGLSTASMIQNLTTAALTMKTTADARRALDEAAKAFDQWQLAKADDEEFEDLPQFNPSMENEVALVGEQRVKGRTLRKFRRTPPPEFATGFEELVYLDAATGFPAIEEMSMGGQKMMRVEYFDIGAEITIEIPAVLATES